ncbi:hypothetical protein BH20ACI1_BH20ACI1_21600 [soil metagenome]
MIESRIIKLVPSENIGKAEKEESKGIVRLRKAKFKDVFFKSNAKSAETFCDGNELKTKASEKTADDDFVYYLDEGESGGVPLFGKVFNLTDEHFADDIADSIRNYVFQNNLKSLDNAASNISSQIDVSFQVFPGKIGVTCSDGKKQFDTSTLGKPQPLKDYEISVDTYFKLNIKNISGEIRRKKDEFAAGESYHITVLSLTNAGGIDVIYSSNGANDPLGDGKEITRLNNILLKSKYPVGIEHYIIIISKDYVDFSFYQSNGTKRDAKSILERMLTQSGKQTRDSGTISDEPDKWDVIHLELNVVDK